MESLNELPKSKDYVDRLTKVLNYVVSLQTFDINAVNPGKLNGVANYSLLHVAVSNIVTNDGLSYRRLHIEYLESLLELFYQHGADFNIKTYMNETPMHIVIHRHRNVDTARELISILHQFGSDLNIANKYLKTPYDLVSEKTPGTVTYNSELSDMIHQMGGLSGSIVKGSFEAVKHLLEYKVSVSVSSGDRRGYTKAHYAVLSNDIGQLERLCLEGAQLTLRDEYGKSVVDLILESRKWLSFLKCPAIKTAIQSQCEFAEIRKVIAKCPVPKKEHDEMPQDENLVDIPKHAFFEKIQTKDDKADRVKKWEQNIVDLCKKPKLMQSAFNIYIKSSIANKQSLLNILEKCAEDAEGVLIRGHLQEYCKAYLEKYPDKSSLIPSELCFQEEELHKIKRAKV